MPRSRFVTVEGKRLHLFEFLMVFLVIAVLVFIGAKYAKKTLDDSTSTTVNLHLTVFSRTIANLYALGRVAPKGHVQLGGVVFYLNEKGWPANTDKSLSSSLLNQSAKECQQLWVSVFKIAPPSTIGNKEYNQNAEYKISLNKNVICRYQFIGNQEGAYFLDYDVSNGLVSVAGY